MKRTLIIGLFLMGSLSLSYAESDLNAVSLQIREAERRLPAHSVKPATMGMLLALEDERDALLKKIEALKKS